MTSESIKRVDLDESRARSASMYLTNLFRIEEAERHSMPTPELLKPVLETAISQEPDAIWLSEDILLEVKAYISTDQQ